LMDPLKRLEELCREIGGVLKYLGGELIVSGEPYYSKGGYVGESDAWIVFSTDRIMELSDEEIKGATSEVIRLAKLAAERVVELMKEKEKEEEDEEMFFGVGKRGWR